MGAELPSRHEDGVRRGWLLDKAAARGALPFSDWEREMAAATNQVEGASHKAVLQALDVDATSVRIWNAEYRRVRRYPMTFKTLAGPVEVEGHNQGSATRTALAARSRY